jgi:hypothetical protein
MSGEMYRCARHPGVETVLRCGRCETPICPRCLVPTPVGARCPTCAQVKRFATGLKPAELAKAVGFGVGAGAVGTIIATIVGGFVPLLAWMVVGFVVGEAVSIGANRKRVRALGPIALICLFLGYELGSMALIAFQAGGRVPLGLELWIIPLLQLRNLYLLIGLLVGALLAWMRVR